MRSKDVRGLPCSDHLKEVIHGCLGSRGKRYEAASDLIAALRTRDALLAVPGMGAVKADRYGQAMLDLVAGAGAATA